ncbi:hypothetical protein [Aurantibacter sp.]|uniref:HYC_CC_PP family protein n=1 Tax=Aurantibacter sp. TaxID=2807103 RepID=UPI0032636D87
MKENFNRFFSVAMAIMVLASTVSWTVSKHYCMGRLMNVALFAHAENCGMELAIQDSFDALQIAEENSCCDNEMTTISGQDELTFSFNDLKLDQQYFLVSYMQGYLALLQDDTRNTIADNQYPPPILVKNIHLLDEVFLI